MKIALHGINFSPELSGIGKYTCEMAEWLARRGHEVRVVTAPPYYPAWQIGQGYSGRSYSREVKDLSPTQSNALNGEGRLWVYRCPVWVPRHPSGLKRLVHLASFAASSLPVMLGQVFWRPDIVWVVEPPFVCAPQAWLLARLSGAQAWLHVQDFEVDAAFEFGLLPRGILSRLAYWAERVIIKAFDRVSTISENMSARLAEKGVMHGTLFPNWVDTEAIYPLTGPSSMRHELAIPRHAIVALYSGNMASKQGLEILIDAARSLIARPDVRFVLCGDGPAKSRLQELASGLSNITFLPLQPVDKLNALLNLADIHLLPQRADAADLVMPSKLTGMLASGRPVLATAAHGTQVASVVAGRGVAVEPGDAQALSAAIEQLATNPQLRSELGAAARAYAVAHLGREAVLGKFEQALLSLVEGKLASSPG
ncbi:MULTISPECIES: glycosyltransferase WbuB [unclassified Burkholderia]|uniref:glycosyltransferase WbuB n=1 Tax=unclassified Burkholderia TaxID=2613784 RepID=UPI00075BBD3B|nr:MULTISPECIES: glycosyltransferase WbuB [unclassified Burkholderia]KVN03503.1 glycosyltransferase WbuB [Burkholderia sp. MSMB1552]KWZ55935.1 glycosyltransferase WbuB [Burkholderia sp. MSMB1588]